MAPPCSNVDTGNQRHCGMRSCHGRQRGVSHRGAVSCRCATTISTRAKFADDPSSSAPIRRVSCWRQVYSCPELMPCLRMISVGVMPAPRLSATISRFCSIDHRRRRSPRVITSTRCVRALIRVVVRPLLELPSRSIVARSPSMHDNQLTLPPQHKVTSAGRLPRKMQAAWSRDCTMKPCRS